MKGLKPCDVRHEPRVLCFQGPAEDAEEESELSITEMKEKRQREKLEAEFIAKAKGEDEEKKKAEDGCSWGIGRCL